MPRPLKNDSGPLRTEKFIIVGHYSAVYNGSGKVQHGVFTFNEGGFTFHSITS